MTEQRVARIRALLEKRLGPSRLEVVDESHLHVGHAGARDGRGHFRVRIGAPDFRGNSRLASHRMIHEALAEMLVTDIHALSIEIEDDR